MCVVNALSYYNVLSILFLRNLQKLFFLAVAYLKKTNALKNPTNQPTPPPPPNKQHKKQTSDFIDAAHRLSHLKDKSMEYLPRITFLHLQFKGHKDIMQSGP